MELYVRSQDKERLERFNSAQISSATILGKEEYYILINLSVFGTYETKERVIEVISEIQKFLDRNILVLKNVDRETDLKGFSEYLDAPVVALNDPKGEKPSMEYIYPSSIVYEIPQK